MRTLLLVNHRLAAKHAAAVEAADTAAQAIKRATEEVAEPCTCPTCRFSCPEERAAFQETVVQAAQAVLDRVACTPAGLPADALMEVVRCLAAEPISAWLR